MFDHSYCQNVLSQSQNRCFKEFASFWRKIPANGRLPQSVRLLEGGRVESLFGRIPFEHGFSLRGASLSTPAQITSISSCVPQVDGGGDSLITPW